MRAFLTILIALITLNTQKAEAQSKTETLQWLKSKLSEIHSAESIDFKYSFKLTDYGYLVMTEKCKRICKVTETYIIPIKYIKSISCSEGDGFMIMEISCPKIKYKKWRFDTQEKLEEHNSNSHTIYWRRYSDDKANKKYAERIEKAFNHLIKLYGGETIKDDTF